MPAPKASCLTTKRRWFLREQMLPLIDTKAAVERVAEAVKTVQVNAKVDPDALLNPDTDGYVEPTGPRANPIEQWDEVRPFANFQVVFEDGHRLGFSTCGDCQRPVNFCPCEGGPKAPTYAEVLSRDFGEVVAVEQATVLD
jgi:hypothetical protein